MCQKRVYFIDRRTLKMHDMILYLLKSHLLPSLSD